ncbi:uncharacterized protein [Haliotis asinina]|uniref:uncharacterized protein n=1 Tax=Haliotis asinina TaxID=109174 RepID=UPI0035321973
MSPPVDGTSVSKKWTAVKVVLNDYMSTATVHGFSRVVGQRLYFGRRFFWLLVVLAAGVALAVQVYAEFEVYNARPTLIKEQLRDIVDTVKEMPTISLCPLKAFEGIVNHSFPSPLTREEMVMQRFAYPVSYISESFLSTVHIKVYGWDDTGHSNRPGGQSFLSPSTLQKLSLSRFMNRSWEIVDGLPAFFNDTDSGEVLKILASSNRVLDVTSCPRKMQSLYDLPCCTNFFSEVFTETGVCQTLNMTALIKGGKRKGFFTENRFLVVVDAKMRTDLTMFTNVKGIQLVVHASDDPVMPTKSGIFVPFATHSKLTIDTTKERKTYAVSPGQLNASGKLSTHCQAEKFGENATLRSCDCPTPCITYTHNLKISSALVGNFGENLRRGAFGVDGETCHSLIEALSKGSHGIQIIDIRFPKKIREVRQTQMKTIGDTLAALGGLIGLFLGFSLVSVAEIGELLFLMLRGITWQMRKKETRVQSLK